jgi:hypothetical protein
MKAGGPSPLPRDRQRDRCDPEVQRGYDPGEERQPTVVVVELMHDLAHVKRGESDHREANEG